jgi:hypothetical protein
MPSDDDLLARLNALKQSSVSLETNYSSSISPQKPPIPTDDLATRFARLGSASNSGSPQPSRTISTTDTHAPAVAPGIAEGIGGNYVDFNEEDERSLEELLGELKDTVGEQKDWELSHKEQQDVGKLLVDMKNILPQIINSRAQNTYAKKKHGTKEELTDWESIEVNVGSGGLRAGNEEDAVDEDEDGKKPTEDEEADDMIAQIMAELEISRKYDPPSPPPENDDAHEKTQHKDGDNNDDLDLPSAPKVLPKYDSEDTQAIEDAFAARLAALSAPSPSQTDSLGLPSAPSFLPQKKPPIQSNLKSRIDDEIDTWCIICQDDATLKCLGCDGDLYCQLCWTEGHRGESAGFEERGHKVVLYARKKKQAAA